MSLRLAPLRAETSASEDGYVNIGQLDNVVEVRQLDNGNIELVLESGQVVQIDVDDVVVRDGQLLIESAVADGILNLGGDLLSPTSLLLGAAAIGAAVGIGLAASDGNNDDVVEGLENVPTEGDDVLVGTPDPDTLLGLGGNDDISGLGGDDTLNGGTGADTFVFGQTSGNDTVTDFTQGADLIDVQDFGPDFDLADVLANAQQDGANTVLTLDAGTTITLENVTATDLVEADFVLAEAADDASGASTDNALTDLSGASADTSGSTLVDLSEELVDGPVAPAPELQDELQAAELPEGDLSVVIFTPTETVDPFEIG